MQLVVPGAPQADVIQVVMAATVVTIIVIHAVVPATVYAMVVQPQRVRVVVINMDSMGPGEPAAAACVGQAMGVNNLRRATMLPIVRRPSGIIVTRVRVVMVTVRNPFLPPGGIVRRVACAKGRVVICFMRIVVLFYARIRFVNRLIHGGTNLFARFTITRYHAAGDYARRDNGGCGCGPFRGPSFF